MKRCFYDRKTGAVFYDLQRRKRETIEVAILSGGKIRVRVPEQMSESKIRRFLKEKAPWIRNQLEQMNKEKEIWQKTRFRDGNTFYYLGQELALCAGSPGREPVRRTENMIVIDRAIRTPQQRQAQLERWYRARAKENIERRVRFFGEQVGELPNKVTVKTQKRRWGSCSSLRNLNFNWKLIMMPQEIIDYVVVHELCHLKEMNHSEHFWRQVGKILPDYRKRKEWLKNNAWKVEWEQI